jgi:hypothetical protein
MPTAAAAEPVADLRLSEAQLRFFETFGFLHLPGAIADIIGEVIAGFERVWSGQGGGHDGKPHDGNQRSCLVPFIDQDERLSMLLDDPRIHGICTSLLGEDFNYMAGDGNFYVGDTGWHPDGDSHDLRFIKIAFYLDELDGSSGALRVIPGSHHRGAYRDLLRQRVMGDSNAAVGVHGRDVPAQVLATRPGDLAIFDHRTFHSSWNGGKRRRMFTMNCCQRWPEHRKDELRNYLAGHARFFIEENVGPAMLRVANARMRRHLEQPMECDDLLPIRVAELRAAHQEPARG